jgi:hypothetical protein
LPSPLRLCLLVASEQRAGGGERVERIGLQAALPARPARPLDLPHPLRARLQKAPTAQRRTAASAIR